MLSLTHSERLLKLDVIKMSGNSYGNCCTLFVVISHIDGRYILISIYCNQLNVYLNFNSSEIIVIVVLSVLYIL